MQRPLANGEELECCFGFDWFIFSWINSPRKAFANHMPSLEILVGKAATIHVVYVSLYQRMQVSFLGCHFSLPLSRPCTRYL